MTCATISSMDQPAQIIAETTPIPPPVSPRPQPPVLPKKTRKIPLIFLVFSGLVLIGGLAFVSYKQKRKETIVNQEVDCQNDSDCVLMINTKGCCHCPYPIPITKLGKNPDLIKYPMVEEIVLPTCPGVACEPCAPISKAKCENKKCVLKEEYPSPAPLPIGEWKTYTNNEFGYEIKYPASWSIASPHGGESGYECSESPEDASIVEFSKAKLKECGFIAEQLPPQEADITVWSLHQIWESSFQLSQPYEEIIFAGEKAIKYAFTEKSELPNVQATRIYFNHKGEGYLIFLKQTDKNGNYDQIYNQVLATFKFLDSPGPSAVKKTYFDPNNVFSLQYPYNYFETKNIANPDIGGWKSAGAISTELPYNTGPTKEADIQILMYLRPKPVNQSLAEFIEGNVLTFYRENNDMFGPTSQPSKITPDNRENIIVDGRNSIWLEGSFSPGITHIEVFIPKDETSLVFLEVYEGTAAKVNRNLQQYEQNKKIIKEILSSLKFLH